MTNEIRTNTVGSKFVFAFFIGTLCPFLEPVFRDSIFKIEILGTVLRLVDELYVVSLVGYTALRCGFRRQNKILLLIILLFLIGLISGVNSKFFLKVSALGAFNVIKSILVYYCFCQYDWNWENFHRFFKYWLFFVPVLLVGYAIELFLPDMRQILQFHQAVEERMGIRTRASFFAFPTMASLMGVVYYVYWAYYDTKPSKWKKIFSIYMVFISLKVKDIVSMLIVVSFEKLKKIRLILILAMGVLCYILLGLYQFLMPEHYDSYFGEGQETAARYVMYVTSLDIANDYAPLGVGWGKFGSPTSEQTESEIYSKYGIDQIWGLGFENTHTFFYDTQWPMIIGETGYLGTLVFFLILVRIYWPFFRLFIKDTKDLYAVMPCLLFIFFIVSSFAKPVFTGPPHSFFVWGIAGIFYSLNNNRIFYERNGIGNYTYIQTPK